MPGRAVVRRGITREGPVSVSRALTNNIALKIAAVVLALVLWTFAKGEQRGDRLMSVPLVVRNLPEDVTTVERVPETIDVVLAGANKELVSLTLWGDVYAFVDMTDAHPGRSLRVSLSPANVVLPRNADVLALEVRNPKSLDLDIDRLVSKRMKIDPMTEGELADGYFMLGWAVSIPDSVTIYGPASVVDFLQIIRTESLDISGRRDRVEASRRIVLDEPWNLHSVPRDVRVVVEVEGTRTTTLTNVPVVFEHEPGFRSATISPLAAEVVLSGAEHRVRNLGSGDVTVIVDARGLPKGTHQLIPIVETPEGVGVEQAMPVRFTVTLE